MNVLKEFNIKNFYNIYMQFLKFGIVGVFNTFISVMIYYVLIYFEVNYIIANTLGFVASVFNAYYWNNRYVFKSEKEKINVKSIMKVFMVYCSTFILNTALLFFMINYLYISSYLAPIINILIITPLNFLFNKYWAFK